MYTLKTGDKAPNFSALDHDGNRHHLTDFLGKITTVMLTMIRRLLQANFM